MGGCYKIAGRQTDIVGVFTNKCPTDAIRGAGRPEATHMIEVTMDQLAHELGMDPLEIAAQELHPQGRVPDGHETPTGVVYDSGELRGDARQAAGAHRPRGVPPRGRKSCARRASTEASGSPPTPRSAASRRRGSSGPAASACRRGGWESAMVRVHNTRRGHACTRARSGHGQGHETGVRSDRRRPARGRSGRTST